MHAGCHWDINQVGRVYWAVTAHGTRTRDSGWLFLFCHAGNRQTILHDWRNLDSWHCRQFPVGCPSPKNWKTQANLTWHNITSVWLTTIWNQSNVTKMTSVDEYVPEATMIALQSMTCLFLSTLWQYRKTNADDTTSNHRRQTTSGPRKDVRGSKTTHTHSCKYSEQCHVKYRWLEPKPHPKMKNRSASFWPFTLPISVYHHFVLYELLRVFCQGTVQTYHQSTIAEPLLIENLHSLCCQFQQRNSKRRQTVPITNIDNQNWAPNNSSDYLKVLHKFVFQQLWTFIRNCNLPFVHFSCFPQEWVDSLQTRQCVSQKEKWYASNMHIITFLKAHLLWIGKTRFSHSLKDLIQI